jgi:quercetin dioxygenase-like cupin family protein
MVRSVELLKEREKFKKVVRNIIMRYENKNIVLPVSNDLFIKTSYNVECKLCSLDNNNMTVVNVIFKENGELPAHSHDRVEKIHVIDGSIVDKISNKIINAGETYSIPPNTTHHIISNYALLTVTWVPAYEEDKNE